MGIQKVLFFTATLLNLKMDFLAISITSTYMKMGKTSLTDSICLNFVNFLVFQIHPCRSVGGAGAYTGSG